MLFFKHKPSFKHFFHAPFKRGYFIERNYSSYPVLPLIIIIVFLCFFGCAPPNKALAIMKLVSIFFNQAIYGGNCKRIDNR